MRKIRELICLYCNQPFNTRETRRKFCSRKCAGFYNNKPNSKKATDEVKLKISNALKQYYQKNPGMNSRGEKHSIAVGKSTKGKYNENPQSLLHLSKRTMIKIMHRLNIPCSLCGWNEWTSDIHHINGKKIPDCDNHNNLSYICPNCHRLVHAGKITKDKLIALSDYLGDRWKDYYYG